MKFVRADSQVAPAGGQSRLLELSSTESWDLRGVRVTDPSLASVPDIPKSPLIIAWPPPAVPWQYWTHPGSWQEIWQKFPFYDQTSGGLKLESKKYTGPVLHSDGSQ